MCYCSRYVVITWLKLRVFSAQAAYSTVERDRRGQPHRNITIIDVKTRHNPLAARDNYISTSFNSTQLHQIR